MCKSSCVGRARETLNYHKGIETQTFGIQDYLLEQQAAEGPSVEPVEAMCMIPW